MPKTDEKMGCMSANIKNLTKVQDVLLKSNEKRKDEIHKISLSSEVFQHMIEEIVVAVNGLADGMEKINDKLDKVLENQGKLEANQEATSARVENLEKKQINWGKVCRWVSKPWGAAAAIVGLFLIAIIVLGIVDSSLILPFLETVKTAKQ